MKRLCSFKHWDRGFESHSRYGCLSAFLLCLCCSTYVAGFRQGSSPVQGILRTVYKIHISRLILMGKGKNKISSATASQSAVAVDCHPRSINYYGKPCRLAFRSWKGFLWDAVHDTLIEHISIIIIWLHNVINHSRDSVVGIATGYGLDEQGVGVGVPVGSRIFSSSRCPDPLWGSPSPLSNGYRGRFPRDKAAGAWSWPLTSNKCRGKIKCGSIRPLPHTYSWRSA
jgi:hypothetical protein